MHEHNRKEYEYLKSGDKKSSEHALGKRAFNKYLFQLCGEGGDEKEKYFLFPNVFDFWFYKSWCYNMGGGVAVANTDEEFHSQMDVAEALVDPQTHEKCMHARCWL